MKSFVEHTVAPQILVPRRVVSATATALAALASVNGATMLKTIVPVSATAIVSTVVDSGHQRGPRKAFLLPNSARVWFITHRDELISKYPSEYVAVMGSQVVAHDASESTVLEVLESLYTGGPRYVGFAGDAEPSVWARML